MFFFFFQAEDGIRDLVRSRGLGDVYKRQLVAYTQWGALTEIACLGQLGWRARSLVYTSVLHPCLLYTSDAADERSSVDLGGRRIIKKKKNVDTQSTTIL